MSYRIVMEADTIEEFDQLLRRVAAGERPVTEMVSPHASEQETTHWPTFVARRSDNQRRVIHALPGPGDRVLLSAMKAAVGLNAMELAGVLGSLQRASKAYFRETLLDPQPWFKNEAGQWDREYIVNPRIVPQVGEEIRE
jgi:hypothetical protein